MKSERYIKAIIYIAVLSWTAVLYINHEVITSEWLKPLSTVITIVLYAVMAFDLWLWKLPFLHSWFVKRPVIDGVWKVEIRSKWVAPKTQAAIPPVEGYMIVRQTFSYLSMRLLTAESSSELVGTEIVCSSDGLYCVSGVYRNALLVRTLNMLKVMRDDVHKLEIPRFFTPDLPELLQHPSAPSHFERISAAAAVSDTCTFEGLQTSAEALQRSYTDRQRYVYPDLRRQISEECIA